MLHVGLYTCGVQRGVVPEEREVEGVEGEVGLRGGTRDATENESVR